MTNDLTGVGRPEMAAADDLVAEETPAIPSADIAAMSVDSLAQSPDSLSADSATAVAANGASAVGSRGLEPLGIAEVLADHLFQASVEGVTDPAVRGPLNDALSSLDRGQESRARNLNRQAQKAADALRDRTPGSSGSLVSWSVLERYFEEAALL